MTNHFAINTEAAIYKNGKWLVGVRSEKESEGAGLLAFIGGTVEHTDALINILESALIREVREEIKVKVKILDFVNSSSFVSKKGNHVVNIVFLCEIEDDGVPEIASDDEIDSLLWLTTKEILNYPNSPTWLWASLKKADSLARKLFNH
jgi:8-oxo-dGTP pyrophosphatase MutT (NUDIX family)